MEEAIEVERVIGKYKILQVIGKGTYGEVFKAIDVETKEILAIKKTITKVNSFLVKSCAILQIVYSFVLYELFDAVVAGE